ncbi:MAG: hypothetical protein PHR21_05410 [Oscillospiraceae bacterium]|nr:hypothetical protein [Oscillospiraceae bacterium]MDD4367979.1 hypothetical protein [Oscillospiraceae bacterium]
MILVCVTDQTSCEAQIRAGARLGLQLKRKVHVLSVMPSRTDGQMNTLSSPALEYLYEISREVHAEMNVFFDNDPVGCVMRYINAQTDKIEGIIVGQPKDGSSNRFLERITDDRSDLPIYMMSASGIMLPVNIETRQVSRQTS